ncbi:MAG: nicotinate (nicotinamide) nucleotide adenylyltransferase [Bacteroidaceae bacterium]|mgnify:FL=1|nr:nicotinate (nicotinamide) nucleotide adenylyltransferase [Bacteroidaceae bacterium]
MRTGIFGGTFNPVHNGHVKLAEAYVSALHLDRLLIIPTNIPPHKTNTGLVDGMHRLAMCKLAFFNHPQIEVCDLELKRECKSYTVDTLEQLTQLYPNDQFYLIMGSDMFCSLTDWYCWQRIIQLAVICAGARQSNMTDLNMHEQCRKLETLGANCELVDFDPLPISSTMIREQIRKKEPIDGLIAPAVADYIQKHHLYQ